MNRFSLLPLLFISLFSVIQFSCNNDDAPEEESIWLVNTDNVLDGGPGLDGIPSVDTPEFALVEETSTVSDDELIVGIKIGEEVRAYPHTILDWHEIVNDRFGSAPVTITYCPLTGTAIGWDGMVNGQATQFGVSGLLYNTNLMPYDRNTNSVWSQMRLDCVTGNLINTKINTVQVLETTYGTWKSLYPNSKVMTQETGFNRNYGDYPYGEYKTSDGTIFPLLNADDRLHFKERVLGVQESQPKVYRFESFNDEEKIAVVNDVVDGKSIVVFGSQADHFMVAFENDLNGEAMNFTPINRDADIIAEDAEGNRYNIFGEVVAGPAMGSQLKRLDQYIGYWLAWGSFQPGIEIYE